MKILVDDVRPPISRGTINSEWIWCNRVDWVKMLIGAMESANVPIDLIDLDHDAGDYAQYGGDYIAILNWLEETDRSYPIRIHSANPVGVTNMRRIIQKNNWAEVF